MYKFKVNKVRENMGELSCSLNDTTVLRNLILENPELPILVFVGEEAWDGDYAYCQADASHGEVKTLTLYKNHWLDEDDYKDNLSNDLCDEEEYKDMLDDEYWKMIDQKVAETEFVKAIVIYVG